MDVLVSEVTSSHLARKLIHSRGYQYDELLRESIKQDNPYLTLEIARKYSITSATKLGPRSWKALLDHANQSLYFPSNPKLDDLKSAFGMNRRIPYPIKIFRDVRINPIALGTDMIRLVTTFLSARDLLNLRCSSWDLNLLIVKLLFRNRLDVQHLIHAVFGKRLALLTPIDMDPGLFAMLASNDGVSASLIAWSVNLTAEHLLIIPGLPESIAGQIGTELIRMDHPGLARIFRGSAYLRVLLLLAQSRAVQYVIENMIAPITIFAEIAYEIPPHFEHLRRSILTWICMSRMLPSMVMYPNSYKMIISPQTAAIFQEYVQYLPIADRPIAITRIDMYCNYRRKSHRRQQQIRIICGSDANPDYSAKLKAWSNE